MKKHLIPVVIALLVVAGTGAAYWFWFSELTRLDTEITELETRIQSAAQAHEKGAQNRSVLQEAEDAEVFVASHFVQTSDIVQFLSTIERSGASFGTLVEVASVSDLDPEGRMLVTLSIAGSFDGVMRTLGVLEHGPYLLTVKSVTLDMSEEGTWTATGSFLVVAKKTP